VALGVSDPEPDVIACIEADVAGFICREVLPYDLRHRHRPRVKNFTALTAGRQPAPSHCAARVGAARARNRTIA
jgi:hypothetical protein